MTDRRENICIIYPNKSSSSETFIQAHVNNLPYNVHVLYGGWFPTATINDEPLSSFFIPKLHNKFIYFLIRIYGIFFKNYVRTKSLLNFFSQKNIKIVMAEYGPTGVAVMDVCEEAGIPLIVHFHGFDAYLNSVIAEYEEKYKELFAKATAIVTVSYDMKQQLLTLGAPITKIYCNPCGVDIDSFKPNINQVDDPVFVSVGRFVNKKASHLTILAFSYMLKEIPNAKLIMIGDGGLGSSGELYLACKQMVSAMDLNRAIEFKGSQPQEEVAKIMKNCLAFVQHSVRPENGDSEGTPVSVLEASASGLPVIATKHGGIKDVIIDSETGYLVNEYDVVSMSERMILLAQDTKLAHKMGTAARERVVENFSMSISIGNLSKIILDSIQQIDEKTFLS